MAAIIKGQTPFDSDRSEGDMSTRRASEPHQVKMCSSLTDMVRLKASCLFLHYVVFNRRRRDVLGIVGSSAVRSRGKQGEKPCVSCLHRSELSA